MLKKKYNGIMVTVIAFAAFAAAMMVLWYFENKYHFGATKITIIVLVVAAITSLLAIRITVWRKGDVKIQPNDYPPEDINPIQAGCIIDGVVNARDVTAAFFYMAQKGYFRISEYELKHFEFIQGSFPEHETKSIKLIYKAIFGDNTSKSNAPDAIYPDNRIVRLTDVAENLIKIIERVQVNTYNGISTRRNREIADLTGKIIGFKESLIANRGEKAQRLVDDNPKYVYEILPYAYAFSITAKLNSNFQYVALDMPSWYHPYGVTSDYKFDVLVYNSMLRNLPEQLRKEVFDKTIDTYPTPPTLSKS